MEAGSTNARLDALDEKVGALDTKIDGVGRRLDAKIDELGRSLNKRIDDLGRLGLTMLAGQFVIVAAVIGSRLV